MSGNSEIVRDFVAACNANDLERMLTFFDPECVYHNIPLEPVSGIEGIRGVLAGFMGMAQKVDWVIHQLAENAEGVVLTERTDRFLVGENWVELPVMGAFELREGKIVGWRDYFDMKQFQSQLAGE
ncbi:MAG: limonene-1,2-epoxide hydrolase family protein [Myxococcota bacterium]|nr:limonene-1,2-epoxide hydrolase family protein [Myxococcota bacterium]